MQRVRDGFWVALAVAVYLSAMVACFSDYAYRPDGWPCKQCMKHEHPQPIPQIGW